MAHSQTTLPSEPQSLPETRTGEKPLELVYRGTHVVKQTSQEIIDELLNRVAVGERIQLNNDLPVDSDVTPDNENIAQVPFTVKDVDPDDRTVELKRGSPRPFMLSIDDDDTIRVTPPNPDCEFEVYSLRVRPMSVEVHDESVQRLRNILEAHERHGFDGEHTLALSDQLAGGQRVFTRQDARCLVDAIDTVLNTMRTNVSPREGTILDKYTAPPLPTGE